MEYRIYSSMARDLAPFGVRFKSHPFLYYTCRAVAWLVLPCAYLGALIAPAGVLYLPFQVLYSLRITPPSIAFWLSAGFIAACTFWMLYRCWWAAIRSIRRHVVHLDAIVLFVGFMLAVACVAFVFSRGGRF
jgi:hypothetical protein